MVYLFKSGAWINASSIFVSVGSFLLYIVFGHFVSKDAYGTYQYLLSVGAIIGAFTLTGMNSAVGRAVARGYEGSFRESIGVQVRWSVLPLVIAWSIGGYYLLHGNTVIGAGLFLIGVFVPINNALNTYSVFLSAKKDFRRGFWYSALVNSPYYLAVAIVGFSFPLAIALLAANLISQCLGLFLAYRKTLATYQPNEVKDPEAMPYGKHLSVINAISTVVAQADSILTFHLLGASGLALYSFATAIPGRIGVFKTIAGAAFPKFAAKSSSEVTSGLGRKVFISIIVAFAMAVAYDALAHPIFELFFPNYLSAVAYSQIYVFIIVAEFNYVYTTALLTQRRTRALYIYNTASPLAQLALEVIGIIGWGLWGLIVARVGAAFISSVFAWALVIIGHKRAKDTARTALPGTIEGE